jgi:apolipoprotein N-acyltransferase
MSFIIRICQKLAGAPRSGSTLQLANPEAIPRPAGKRWMAFFGCLLALSAPGFNVWPLAWVALIPALLWAKRQPNLKTVLAGAFWLGFCFSGLYCIWFFDLHPLTWLGFTELGSRLTTLAGWLLIAFEGGLVTALAFGASAFLKHALARCLIFPILWISCFWLLHSTPMALPWGMLEYTQASLPAMRWLAGWIGASGLTFVLVLHNTAWAAYLERHANKNFRWAGVLALPIAVWMLGLLPAFQQTTRPFPLPVAAVQANFPIEAIRCGRLTAAEIKTAYLQPLMEKNLPAGTLVAYPEEGVVPDVVSGDQPFQNPMMQKLQAIARKKKVSIAVGVIFQDSSGTLYNSIAFLTPSSNPQRLQVYHKRKLVPFGEFTPYGFGNSLKNLLARWDVDYHAPFSSGKKAPLLRTGHVSVGGLLCFDLIDANPLNGGFSGDYQRRGAKLLLNSSNLGWFHENPLIEAQFLAIGQMRAAENRLPLIISSNTGISAIISASGEVLARTQPFTPERQQTQIITYPFHSPASISSK